MDLLQIAVLTAETLLLASLLLVAFRVRDVLGLTLVGVALGVMQPLQVQLSATLYAEPVPGVLVSPGSVVLFAASLLVVLLVYIREDAVAVRQVVYGLLVANIVVSALYLVFGVHLLLPGTRNLLDVPAGLYVMETRVMLSGTAALMLDVLLLVILYDRLAALRSVVFLRAWITLTLVLAIDSVVFSVLAFAGTGRVADVMLSGIAGRTVTAGIYAGAVAFYARFVEPDRGLPSNAAARDVFHALTYREKYALEREAAQAARARESRLRSLLLEATTDGILVLARDGTIRDVNPAGERTLGTERDALVGCAVSIVLPDLDVEAAMPGPVETSGLRPDGSRFPAEVGGVRAPGDEELTVLSLRDVTEAHARREAELHDGKMRSVGLLASGVAHDFNNLLSVILGAVDLTRQRGRDVEELALVEDAARRAAELTGQLLAFARKQVLDPRVVDVGARLQAMEPMLARVLGEDVKLVVQIGQAHPVRVSPSLLDQVVLNLVANARDALPHGGEVVLGVSGDAEITTIEVRDDGVGMAPDILGSIFEPYFTTKAVGRGTGLGLSMCAGIVEQSGGRIRVRSAPGEGAAFTVALPAVLDALPEAREPTPPAAPQRSGTVLLVEDNDDMRGVVCGLLELRGYRVIACASAVDALDTLVHTPVDVLLTDLVMPEMDGRSLADQARRLRPDLRVLVMTGHDRGETQDEWPVLRKPFAASELFSAIERELGRSGAVW
ncbi:MAG: response regulator [Myxococcales bacterium]|nr:response regulator [Myxococcales bacterium]MCB9668972.1 response regulator [Alphaproteobacteria bacterium]MCB9691299.1 response regulator [Alphaproteobacteria bacterium]